MRKGGEGVEEAFHFDDVLKGKLAEEDGAEDLKPGFGRLSAFAEGGGVVEKAVEDENLELKGKMRRHCTVARVGWVSNVGCRAEEVEEEETSARGRRQETKKSWPRKKEG